MTGSELKDALLKMSSVKYKSKYGVDVPCKCVSAIIYRKAEADNSVRVSAELICETGNSIIVCESGDVFNA